MAGEGERDHAAVIADVVELLKYVRERAAHTAWYGPISNARTLSVPLQGRRINQIDHLLRELTEGK